MRRQESVVIDFSDMERPVIPSPNRILLRRAKKILNNGRDTGLVGPIVHSVSSPNVPQGLEDLIKQPLTIPILRVIKNKDKSLLEIEHEINILKRYKKGPLFFWRDELGIPIDRWKEDYPPTGWRVGDPVPLWSKQREIIEMLVKYKKVAVRSGHSLGKTFLAAGLSLYFALVHHAIGLTTAPTFRQVRRALWGEIHYLYNKSKNPLGGKLNQVSLDLGDKWFVEGFATDKPMENITGIHEENVFVIIDEAGGVAQDTFDALDAILTSENSYVLAIGNPIKAQGPFADAFKPDSGYQKVHISCYECPNVRYKRNIYSKLVSYDWVKDKEKKWGIESNLFKIRVDGSFPTEDRDVLIPYAYIQAALDRGKFEPINGGRVVSYGVDVARYGSNSSVIGKKYDSGLFKIIAKEDQTKETVLVGRIKFLYDLDLPKMSVDEIERKLRDERKEGKEVEDIPLPPINVDDIGVGAGVVDMLEDDGYPVNGINVSEPPDDNDEDAHLFLNKRAQYYWKVRKLFIDGKIILPDDDYAEDLVFELSKLKVEFLRSGKMKIVDKETLKKEIGRSPDHAESLMLACSIEETEINRDLVRIIR